MLFSHYGREATPPAAWDDDDERRLAASMASATAASSAAGLNGLLQAGDGAKLDRHGEEVRRGTFL